MDVNGIRDRIVELSHDTAVDGEVESKAIGWLNAAYHELMDEVVAYLPPSLQRLESVSTSIAGTVTLASTPYRTLRVVDKGTGTSLEVVSPAVILDVDPMGNASGSPQRCTVDGAVLTVHPAGVANLSVLYVPAVSDLAEDGSEASILLPKAHHHALVWGGMVWSSLFERGFGTQGELLLYQRNWAEAKERVKLSLLTNTGEVLRVEPYALV